MRRDDSQHTTGAQTVGRALDVLRVVASFHRGGATMSKVMLGTQLSRSTAFRLLRYMTEQRMLVFDKSTRRYAIGPLAFELGLAGKRSHEAIDHYEGLIERVSLETGFTTHLISRSSLDVVCLNTIFGYARSHKLDCRPGRRLPLGVGAASIAMLADLGDDQVAAVIAANSARYRMYGPGRITATSVRRDTELARKNAYALSMENVAPGVTSVGVVIPGLPPAELLSISVTVAGELSHAEAKDIAATARRAIADSPPGPLTSRRRPAQRNCR